MTLVNFDTIIGHTGLVGSHICASNSFSHYVNSRNIDDYVNRDLQAAVVTAGDARKWYAKDNPTEFEKAQDELFEKIASMNFRDIILISTTDVLDISSATEERVIDPLNIKTHYGKVKYKFEQDLGEICNLKIIRLPGLFGAGLKKNLIFDLINNSKITPMNPASTFQMFDLINIKSYLDLIIRKNIPLLHLAVEPTSVLDICTLFGRLDLIDIKAPKFSYDMKSIYAQQTSDNSYFQNKTEVINGIIKFRDSYYL
jgi:dTDP-4-dehydrorhamnose reductase